MANEGASTSKPLSMHAIYILKLSADERLLAAARTDNEEMLLDVFDKGGFDINFQDG